MSDYITAIQTATGPKQIDYDALVHKPDLSSYANINDIYTKEQTLAAATKTLYGLTDGAVPNDILNKLAQSLLYSNGNMSDVQGNTITLPGVKIATGSYVGTGTYGASNPCSLTFNFEPKLVIVDRSSGMRHTVFLNGMHQVGSGSSSVELYVTWSGTTLRWYSVVSKDGQLNDTRTTYHYVAIT